MRRLFLSFSVCVLSFVSNNVALAEADVKIAVVDIQRALSESTAGAKAQKQYEKKVREAQEDLDEKKNAYEQKREKYSKKRDSLSEGARVEQEEELVGLERDLKRTFQDVQNDLRRRNAKVVGELVEKLRKVVDGVGKEGGYDVILERSSQAVLFANSSYDITDKVIKEFNKTN